jgi:hypothetical protein
MDAFDVVLTKFNISTLAIAGVIKYWLVRKVLYLCARFTVVSSQIQTKMI